MDAAPPGLDPFPASGGFVAHPNLKPGLVESRDYQTLLARDCLERNTLVVLPTGLGKTVVAALVIAEMLRQGRGTALLLAPTRPLAHQHADSMARLLAGEHLVEFFSGQVAPSRRAERWGAGVLIVATPQTVRNDLDAGRYDLSKLGLIVFDEAHHAVGDYAYVDIAKRLPLENPRARVLGLTASPGSDSARLEEVKRLLRIVNVRSLDERSPEVARYLPETSLETKTVPLSSEIKRVQKFLDDVLKDRVDTLRRLNLIPGNRPWGPSRRELIAINQMVGAKLGRGRAGGFDFAALQAAQVALHADLAQELLETQGLETLRRHLERLAAKPEFKRAEKSFLNDPRVVEVRGLLAKGFERSHPKIDELTAILAAESKKKPDATAIVFAHFRDTLDVLHEHLNAQGIATERFFGQGRRGESEGMKQSEQKAVLDRFRRREFRVLVSTSVGEEGIDVPQVDLVVFYEAVPSEIRAIQRRGRTGRTAAGRVVVLLAEGSRDEAYAASQTVKERRMKKLIRKSR